MKTLITFFFTLIIFASATVFANDNAELQRLFDEDQAARQNQDVDWDTLDKEDAERREAVLGLITDGEVRTGLDYFNAAIIFQHGETVEDIRIAHSLATISAMLGFERAKWLQAASWDRMLIRFEQPQWYGTQFNVDESGKWKLHEVNPDVITDEQRAEWLVPSLEESKARAESRNEG